MGAVKIETFIQRHPLSTFFGVVFTISWGSGLIALGPKLVRGDAIPTTDALLLFPVLVLGVALTGIILTSIVDGRRGVQHLFSRIVRWRVGSSWYAVALLIPPILIMLVLLALSSFVSPDFAPGFFPLGVLFGIVSGFFEEIGWMGYAFPKMQPQHSTLVSSVVLGVLWGLWHLPVVDSLGAAAPHGAYWVPFFWPSSRS